MSATVELVKFLATLANITLTDQELQEYTMQLDDIIQFITQVKTMETKDIAPKYHSVDLKNVFAQNSPGFFEKKRTFTQEQALANAKAKQDGYFVVDKVIDK